jgi:electron transport complex protein RnfB
MVEDVYTRLAEHLDNLPGGYPATESGVELRILRRLFTEEEAELAVHLALITEPAEEIAARAGIDEDRAVKLLAEMSEKGLIYRIRRSGVPLYSASQFVVGIWEYHVNDLDPGLIRDFNEYIPALFDPEIWRKAPQLRTIPIGESIPQEIEILNYERADKLVRSRSKIAVAPCICRREHRMIGEGCDKPEETCLVFGRAADYYIENGLGRAIDVEEALAILALAEDAGLVLQPSNSQRISNICCCCGCCCQVLLNIKKHPHPASLVSTPFQVASDADLCIGCGECIPRCQMDALSLEDDHIVVDLKRCIGCGLCVTACETESLYLVRKPDTEQPKVPMSLARAYINLGRVRGVIGAQDMGKMALRVAKGRLSGTK